MADITPSTMASQLATMYTSAAQSLITSQTKSAQAASSALTKLQSALSAFDTALNSLSGSASRSLVQRGATLSNPAIGTVTASATAQPGNYSFFVEQVAARHQVAFEDLPAVPVSLGGPLVVTLADGRSFTANIATADQNNDGTISQAEIARAINQATENQGKVTATTVTVGGKTQLVLSAGQTGVNSRITLDTSGLPNSDLKTAFTTSIELSAARDAIVWLGDKDAGIKLQQASNTLTAVDGVSITLAKAMQSGDAPISLTVSNDDSGTSANVKKFIDAYNTLKKTLDDLTANGKDGVERAAFASDAGVLSLRNRMSNALRQSYGGLSLAEFGINADRNGTLSLNDAKLQKTLAAHPEGLDAVFGNTGLTTSSGALGAFHSIVKSWTDSASGQIKQRQNSVQAQQKTLATRQTRLDNQYTQAYNRYLAQFTQLQSLQARMNDTSSLLSNLGNFGTS
ncbi:lateral flagellar hook-associated protein 2 [Acidovorax sp. SRB_14]|uniref:flagellar filament capping protein FliD n=1 Tax=Acidovorax sp. SRB_14 TaxID=1962699 RepID=UPI001563D580|nr:flagellar filament capping protein FliD [Acidovorax sp. SRB_14]NMM79777.1 lateral flagellar hook-associated protein 2 [Acidovorax sp. SRB_14]